MATGEIVLATDGEIAIKVGPWAREKILYIRNLCEIFNTGMKNRWPVRTYIDLFAGPGVCVIERKKEGKTGEEILGSPLVALSCKTPFTHYFFNDVRQEFINALRVRATSYGFPNLEYYTQDCNSIIDNLLLKLPRNSLDFCFIDPLNWEIKFETIRRLTKNRKMDLAITFHIGNIKRSAANPTQELIDFFPDSSWHQEYLNAREGGKPTGRLLLDAYEQGLRDIGYSFIRDGVLEKNNRNVPIYHLIFASRHPRGSDFWDKVTERQATGQIRMSIPVGGVICQPAKSKSNSTIVKSIYLMLNGNRSSIVQQVGDGSIITRFDRTPLPTKDTDIVCPHFLELKWAYGCPFDCAWCYLKGTFRFHPTKTKPVFKDLSKIELHTRAFLEEVEKPEILNTGEIADSLMGESLNTPFSKFIIPMFEKQNKHKVLFLTKSDNIKNLLEISPHNQVIVSFSLNANEVAKKWESGAPSVDRRIEASRKLNEAGYEVRVRIDPMVPVPEWEKLYLELAEKIFSSFVPSRITLGSLRGLQTTINGSTDKSWLQYLKENSNWGKKIDFSIRRNMYATLISFLKENYNYTDIGLCKETVEMWRSLGMDYRKIKCNCIW